MPIKQIIKSSRVPVKMWTNDVDEGSIRQLKNVADLPFVFHHVAAMPDVHVGMGATIGSVIATKGAVIPAAVGVDIGCGMAAVKLNLVTRTHLLTDKKNNAGDEVLHGDQTEGLWKTDLPGEGGTV